MKTQQEQFNDVCRHFVKMMGPSRDAGGHMCMYRGPGGNKCFVGGVIPDDKYTPQMEGKRAYSSPVQEVLTELGYHPYFMRDLQAIHDDTLGMHLSSPDWQKVVADALCTFAEDNNLLVPSDVWRLAHPETETA